MTLRGKTVTTLIEETLAALKQYASATELDEREAHSEATRLAEVADAAATQAHKAFDRVGRLSDRAEAALEAFEAYRESVTGIN